MASTIGSLAVRKTVQRMSAASGFRSGQLRAQNVAPDLAEHGDAVSYPAVYVYCEKIVNKLAEKFRSFSGTVQVAVEIRQSQDRLAGLEEALEKSADAGMQALDGSRGTWGDGMYYTGGYQVAFTTVKRGGRGYLQTAKITFEIGVSIS